MFHVHVLFEIHFDCIFFLYTFTKKIRNVYLNYKKYEFPDHPHGGNHTICRHTVGIGKQSYTVRLLGIP